MLAWVAPARATTVAIVASPNPSPDVSEALTRIQGELLSEGLDVTIGVRPAADSRGWLAQVASERGASAVIDVVGDSALSAVDVWVVKKQPGRFEVTRVSAESDTANPAERIALRAMDALRATLIEIDWATREPHDQPIATPKPETVPSRERLGFELGVAGIASLGGVGISVTPVVRVDLIVRPWLVLQTSLAGLGSRPAVTAADSEARLAQQFALLSGSLRFRPDSPWWPMVSLGAGVLHTSLDGRTGADTLGLSVDQWSLVVDAGLGVGARLSRRTFLTLAAHGQLAAPYVVVHLEDTAAATVGRPNLLGVLTLGAWL